MPKGLFLLRGPSRIRRRLRRAVTAVAKFVRNAFVAIMNYDDGTHGPLASFVNRRVGHTACVAADGRILLWGGYQETRPTHFYWPAEIVIVFDPFTSRFREVVTTGNEKPSMTSGAVSCIVGSNMFVLCGFSKANQNHILPPMPDFDDAQALQAHLHLLAQMEPFVVGDNGFDHNINEIYSLDMNTWRWTKRHPVGPVQAMRSDKLACWTHNGKIFLFGGFGPSCAVGAPEAQFYRDPNTPATSSRGWNNQLVRYDPETDVIDWPKCYGDVPTPRAAHAVADAGDNGVFVFGGRLDTERMNDLYHLDLDFFRWTRLHPEEGGGYADREVPRGRSWHSLTASTPNLALLYGGYSSDNTPLGDCWTLDTTDPGDITKKRWTRCPHLEQGDRLWHQAVRETKSGQVWLFGGVMDNLLNYDAGFQIRHPPTFSRLSTSPLPLLHLAAKAAVAGDVDKEELSRLPEHIRNLTCLYQCQGA